MFTRFFFAFFFVCVFVWLAVSIGDDDSPGSALRQVARCSAGLRVVPLLNQRQKTLQACRRVRLWAAMQHRQERRHSSRAYFRVLGKGDQETTARERCSFFDCAFLLQLDRRRDTHV